MGAIQCPNPKCRDAQGRPHIIPDTAEHCAYCGTKIGAPATVPVARCKAQLRSVEELANHFYLHWDEGRFHLYRGDLERWFQKDFHRADLEQAAIDVRTKYQGNDEDAGLQELLDLCGVPGPALKVDSAQLQGSVLDLGQVDKGGTINVILILSNSTRGYLYGKVVGQPWLQVSGNGQFACSPANPQTQMTVGLNTEMMREIPSPTSVLEIYSNDKQTPKLALSMKVLFNPRLKIAWTSGGASQPPPIDFGEVAKSEKRMIIRSVKLTNTGGRVLQGTVHPNGWLKPVPSPFPFGPLTEAQSATVSVVADTSQLDVKRSQVQWLPIKTNVGDERVPARISIKKWWFATAVAVPLAFSYAVLGVVFMWILAGFAVDLWWYGSALLEMVRSAGIEYFTRASLLGMTGASLYLLKPLIEELEYYYFRDKFQARLTIPVSDRQRTIYVTLVLILMGLVIGGIAETMKGQGTNQVVLGSLTTAGVAGVLGVLTTMRAHAWIVRQPLKTLRPFLLVLAASVFYATSAFIVAGGEIHYVMVWQSGVLGAVWALFVVGSESTFWPAIVRVRLHQIAQAWLVMTLSLIGFYGIDIFRSLTGPGGWNIPTQIHFPGQSYDTAQTIIGLFGSFVMAIVSSCVAFGGLIAGLSAGAIADSDVHTSELRKQGVKAWQTLPLGNTLKTLWQSAVDGKRFSIPDFSVLKQLYTSDIRELVEGFTHWPGTSERNWATTLVAGVVCVLAGYLALVGGISLVMIPVMIAIGIVIAVIYIIVVIIAVIAAILAFLYWLGHQ